MKRNEFGILSATTTTVAITSNSVYAIKYTNDQQNSPATRWLPLGG